MKKKLLSVLMAAVMVAGVGGVGAAQVKADDEKTVRLFSCLKHR